MKWGKRYHSLKFQRRDERYGGCVTPTQQRFGTLEGKYDWKRYFIKINAKAL